jgi:uncharacterized membrane protein AbrB (regulator of aidB expression)
MLDVSRWPEQQVALPHKMSPLLVVLFVPLVSKAAVKKINNNDTDSSNFKQKQCITVSRITVD